MTQPFAMNVRRALLLGALVGPIGCADSNQPNFGSTQIADRAPPPISGGTLIALRDGKTAVASDPDRDAIFVVDLPSQSSRRIALQPGDEPGRLIQDGDGNVHVALRSAGAMVKIDPKSATILDRSTVCPAPRGMAHDGYLQRIYLACAGGELMTLSDGGGPPIDTKIFAEGDLRDVVIEADHLLVTRFRSSELLTVALDAPSTLVRTDVNGNGNVPVQMPPSFTSFSQAQTFVPTVAWRAIGAPTGGAFIVHQRGVGDDGSGNNQQPSTPVSTGNGGYGDSGGGENPGGNFGGNFSGGIACNSSIVHSAISHIGPNGGQLTAAPFLPGMVLPVDLALSPDGSTLAVIAAGNARLRGKTSVVKVDVANYFGTNDECFAGQALATGGQVTAVAFTPDGRLLVQRREPAAVDIIDSGTVISLADDSREDTGHAVFHSNSSGDIACASCHPEGGEDGHTWQFVDIGSRRTQSLRGGVMALAPFHWSGDMPDMRHLTDQVFVTRMSGPRLDDGQLGALENFIDKVPTLPKTAPADPGAVDRGHSLFNDPSVGCASCHNGAHFTNLASVDVGTGGAFIVPQLLGVANRAPFLHTGCAKTLRDRFDPSCGGGELHGHTGNLQPAQIDDLVAYLDTL